MWSTWLGISSNASAWRAGCQSVSAPRQRTARPDQHGHVAAGLGRTEAGASFGVVEPRAFDVASGDFRHASQPAQRSRGQTTLLVGGDGDDEVDRLHPRDRPQRDRRPRSVLDTAGTPGQELVADGQRTLTRDGHHRSAPEDIDQDGGLIDAYIRQQRGQLGLEQWGQRVAGGRGGARRRGVHVARQFSLPALATELAGRHHADQQQEGRDVGRHEAGGVARMAREERAARRTDGRAENASRRRQPVAGAIATIEHHERLARRSIRGGGPRAHGQTTRAQFGEEPMSYDGCGFVKWRRW